MENYEPMAAASEWDGVSAIYNWDGLPLDLEAISAIGRQNKKNFTIIGTAFFISSEFVFVTARHNFKNDDETVFGKKSHEKTFLYCPLLSSKQIVQRPVKFIHTHEEHDVAVGFAGSASGTRCSFIRPSPVWPQKGDTVLTMAFPESEVSEDKRTIFPNIEIGSVTEILSDGVRGEWTNNLRMGPGFRTTLHLRSGSSGGPVFNRNGQIIGLNTSGFEGENESFVSWIGSIKDLTVGFSKEKPTVPVSKYLDEQAQSL
jgi:S1-C subfamily serine protease